MSKFSRQKEFKISEESALLQIQLILEYFDIDIETMQEGDGKKSLENNLELILQDIKEGKLEVDNKEGFKIIQHKEGTPIEYKKFGADIKLAMKDCKPEDHYGKIYELLGSSSCFGSAAIKLLKPKDLKVAERLALLFL